jgi:hypothetical protein
MQACSLHGTRMRRKPIVLVAEEEERFHPFDYERWKNDQLQKTPDPSDAAKGFTWTGGVPAGGVPFGKCPQAIKELIEKAWNSHAHEIMFFRRRDFEACSLAREIVRRASEHGALWGRSLPLTSAWQAVSSGPRQQLNVRLVWDAGNEAGCEMAQSLRASLLELNARYQYAEGRAVACAEDGSTGAGVTHVIVALTDLEITRWLAKDTPAERQLLSDIETLDSRTKFIVVYDQPKGLNSPVFGQIGKHIDAEGIRQLLWSHEALVFRRETRKYGSSVRRRVLGAVSTRCMLRLVRFSVMIDGAGTSMRRWCMR